MHFLPGIVAQAIEHSNYYQFNPYAIPGFISAFLILALGVGIFAQKKNSGLNVSFLIFCISIWMWLSGVSMMYLSKDPFLGSAWFSFSFIGISLISVNIFTFTAIFVDKVKQYRKLIYFGYALAVYFCFFFFQSHYFFSGVRKYFWGWYAAYGVQSLSWQLVWSSYLFATTWLLLDALKYETNHLRRQQLKYINFGLLIGYIGAADHIPAYGIELYPFGYIPILCFISILAYAIKKHRLLILTPAVAADTIVNTMADALIVFGVDKTIISVNPVAVKLFGYSDKEITSKSVQDIFAEKMVFEEEMLNYFIETGYAYTFEMSAVSNKGDRIPVSMSIAVVRNKSKKISGFVGIARDISENKRNIEELRRKTEETERELAERKKAEAALQVAYTQMQSVQAQLLQSAKMAAVGQLAAGVAHEINNPLCIILGFAQRLNRGLNPDDIRSISLQNIEREAKRCRDLVRDLLTFSQVYDGTGVRACDINEVIMGALVFIETEAKYKAVALTKELEGGIKKIIVDPNQIQQVIINLCNNSIDAMNEKGSLMIKSRMVGDTVVIQVSDTGMGIPKDIQGRIFDPFFTTKEVGKGTGLGLSLSYEIIQKHKGMLEFESEVGKGTTFRVILPVGT